MTTGKVAVSIAFVVGTCAFAQNRVLEFATPLPVQDVDAAPSLLGHLHCESDGSILTQIDGYTAEPRHALLGIRPDGSVTNFSLRSVPGFNVLPPPKSIVAGNRHVYLLVDARVSSGERSTSSRQRLVLVFNEDGSLNHVVLLNHDLNPLVLGVFPSGRMLLVSESLNHRMELKLIDANGGFIRDIQVNESGSMKETSQLSPSPSPAISPRLLIASTEFIPSGDHLLLVPFKTSDMPILELDENRIIASVMPHIPENVVLVSMISAGATSFKVQLGDLIESDKVPVDSQEKVLSVGIKPAQQITEISRKDGTIIQQFPLAAPVEPACESDGAFHFLSPNSDGRLRVVTAQMR